MDHRQRTIAALTFAGPDKVPFEPGNPRQSTLAAWCAQGLPDGVDWLAHLLEVLGLDAGPPGSSASLGVDVRMIPQFQEQVLEHKDGHYVVQDWKGNVCEISDEYDVTYLRKPKDFVTRRWIRCPVAGRDDWERMKLRYDLDSPGRFPEDLDARCQRLVNRDRILSISLPGPFWQMREWCGFETLCLMMIQQPDLVAEMADFWRSFITAVLKRILKRITPDRLLISEDMAYKAKAMISPAMTRRFLKPCYDEWCSLVSSCGVSLIEVDSDGFVGELIPIWLESGVNVCSPVEVAAGNDIIALRRRFGRRIAYRQGVDKRAVAAGGAAVEKELSRLEPLVRGGGYIPGCDHGVPADVSWPNFVVYSRLLARMTGWL